MDLWCQVRIVLSANHLTESLEVEKDGTSRLVVQPDTTLMRLLIGKNLRCQDYLFLNKLHIIKLAVTI